ncbi:MAG: HPr family phosphocarrier protein [Planctomycetes bacterium]|nr:HPr family phosphocarrier protein [Planctomycetota bacterium]
MLNETILIENKVGLHSRPASLLINAAKKYQSKITLRKDDKSVDVKSLIALLKLRVKMGDSVTITAEGEDEGDAIDELVGLIRSKFGEE